MKPVRILMVSLSLLAPLSAFAQTGTAFQGANAQAKLEAERLLKSNGKTKQVQPNGQPVKVGGKQVMLTLGTNPAPATPATPAVSTAPCPALPVAPPMTSTDITSYTNPFGANLDVLTSFGDTGANGIPSAQNTIQTEALSQIQFESPHFFFDWARCSNLSISHRPTFSFGGTVGLVPAVVLEDLTTSSSTALAKPNGRPMFQDAFGWTLTARMNVATSHMTQLDLFGTLGEDYILSQVTSFKQGDDTITATPIANGVGQSALFEETGVQFKLLSTDIINAYSNQTDVLDPPFDISVGYRRDSRFNPSMEPELLGIRDPQNFAFLRFEVGLNKIGNWSGTEVLPGKGYTFKFGIDYERSLAASILPASTRYYVSANVDVETLFKGSAQPSGTMPTINNIYPMPASPGAQVNIGGNNFGSSQGMSTVTFGPATASASDVINWSSNAIVLKVPSSSPTGQVPVTVTVGGVQSNTYPFTVPAAGK